ncbi:MAG: hypothetical protein QNJ68_21620 [Microcoleaceae cyanobacterium MO_207.B10]|nr:hypothetical protein [Microcoleaceae cyanobacterium MO_207.B10]
MIRESPLLKLRERKDLVVVHSNGKRSTGKGDGEMRSLEEIKKYISSPLPCRTTRF